MKNNRLKVIVNDGLGNITEKNFNNIHDLYLKMRF